MPSLPRRAFLAAACFAAACTGAPSGPVPVRSHRFLACGARTRIVEADGQSREIPIPTRDGQILPNGNALFAVSRCDAYPHGAVLEMTPAGEKAFEFAGTQSEVNTAQRLQDGNTMLTEAGPHPRILEVDPQGKVVVDVPIRCQLDNHHMQSRMTRKLANGNYLVPQLLDRVVREYTPQGEVVWEFRTPDVPKEAWPFTAIRLGDGNTLVTCTHSDMAVEVDPWGRIVWQVSNADFAVPLLHDICGAERLPNGNTVLCSYAIGHAGTRLVEVDRQKRVVWTFAEPEGPGIHEVHVLATDGSPLTGTPLR
ncbi:MAG: hypothetical protein U1E73_04575 [Planctomycetota bacterium]